MVGEGWLVGQGSGLGAVVMWIVVLLVVVFMVFFCTLLLVNACRVSGRISREE